jgi:large subunit ribosomal protein L27e
MAKFYKPGRVVVVTNGKFAGKKGIIVRSNFEQTKTKKYPHCLVIGLSKYPRRVTKRFVKKWEEKIKALEQKSKDGKGKKSAAEKLKRCGVFVKTYNMNHILATRYKVTDNFGIDSHMDKIERIEGNIKEIQSKINSIKDAEEKKEEVKKLQNEVGDLKTSLKNSLNDCKLKVGEELFNRFWRGFVKTRDNTEENEKIAASEYLFTKLKF